MHPCWRCALCRGLNLSTQPCRVPSLAALPQTGKTAFSLRRLAPSTLFSSSLSCISRISALYAPPPVLSRLAIWLMFRPMADRAAFIRLISVVSSWMIYPSIAIFRRYAPYRRVGSCAIFSSMSRFSSSVT